MNEWIFHFQQNKGLGELKSQPQQLQQEGKPPGYGMTVSGKRQMLSYGQPVLVPINITLRKVKEAHL